MSSEIDQPKVKELVSKHENHPSLIHRTDEEIKEMIQNVQQLMSETEYQRDYFNIWTTPSAS